MYPPFFFGGVFAGFRRARVGTGFSPISAAARVWALDVAGSTVGAPGWCGKRAGVLECAPMDGTLMFHVKLVVAKSALLRFPLRGKLHTLPCSSSPHKAKRAALRGPLV